MKPNKEYDKVFRKLNRMKKDYILKQYDVLSKRQSQTYNKLFMIDEELVALKAKAYDLILKGGESLD